MADGDGRKATVVQVADAIREAIKVGRFSPGHRLVEADLTREFGVSRGSVREALARLEAAGLVEMAPHRGATVRQVTRKDVVELFAVREILEGGAARLAAERIGEDGNRKRMRATLAEARRWTRSKEVAGYAEANEAFHEVIFDLAGIQLIRELASRLQTPVYRVLVDAFFSIDRVRIASGEHVEIATAVLAGDGRAAEAAMRSHIRGNATATLALTSPFFREPDQG